MSGDFVNLNDIGQLTRAGQGYGADAESGANESRTFENRMSVSQAGLRGRAGMQFTGMTGTHAGNLRLLGAQFAEQALRAVRGEQTVVSADEDAHNVQQATASTVESQTSMITRPINT